MFYWQLIYWGKEHFVGDAKSEGDDDDALSRCPALPAMSYLPCPVF